MFIESCHILFDELIGHFRDKGIPFEFQERNSFSKVCAWAEVSQKSRLPAVDILERRISQRVSIGCGDWFQLSHLMSGISESAEASETSGG
jgi:hypothetical protein